jgi:anti-sigma regulatory factor (Ser/Thr protein kinase)
METPAVVATARRRQARMTKTERLNQRFVAEPHAVTAARHSVEALSGVVDQAAGDKLALLVSELVANAVRHGSRRPTDPITVRIWTSPGTVRVQVSDRGSGLGRIPRPRPGELRVRGWGLFLVAQIADRWGKRSGARTDVWFELDAPVAA